jgi:hypothetical protein
MDNLTRELCRGGSDRYPAAAGMSSNKASAVKSDIEGTLPHIFGLITYHVLLCPALMIPSSRAVLLYEKWGVFSRCALSFTCHAPSR